jgi:hypothetical protein
MEKATGSVAGVSQEFVRPKQGPWIVPANQAKGKYVHTERGIAPISDFVSDKKLRQDQLSYCWIRGRRIVL